MEQVERKIILAITGASGSIYAKLLLEKLQKLESPPSEIAVILSSTGRDIWMDEIGQPFTAGETIKEWDNNTYYAPFASGSARYDTMIICPASMGIAGRIANGISDNLITRTADVMLKESRKLIIVPREMPLNLIHVENLKKLILAGAIVCPASPSFYSKPATVEEAVETVINRVIDLAGFSHDTYRWMEND